MAFCQNKRCNCVYHGASWLGKYCSQGCAYDDNRADWKDCAPLYDPNDPTGRAVIEKNRGEVDAMLEAAAIDPRLPKIIMLRRNRKTQRAIAAACGFKSHKSIPKILKKCSSQLLREC